MSLCGRHFTILDSIQNRLLLFCSFFIPFFRIKIWRLSIKKWRCSFKNSVTPDCKCMVPNVKCNYANIQLYTEKLITRLFANNQYREVTRFLWRKSNLVHCIYCFSVKQPPFYTVIKSSYTLVCNPCISLLYTCFT